MVPKSIDVSDMPFFEDTEIPRNDMLVLVNASIAGGEGSVMGQGSSTCLNFFLLV